jgi:hypothetical protein
MICPKLPPEPKTEGIEGPSCAESAPGIPRDQATAKNSIFFIDTSFFCGYGVGAAVEGHRKGDRWIIGMSKVRSQNGSCQGSRLANASRLKKRISNIEQGISNAEVLGTSRFNIPCSIFEIIFPVLWLFL